MTKLITSVFLLLICNYSFAENNTAFDEKIKNAEVIFIGKIIDRYEQVESILLSNGESLDKVYTTHIFSIEEVLKGNIVKDAISVKLRGGYDSELKRGSKYNKGVYYYENDNESESGNEAYSPRALLFLSYDKLNKFYYSTQDSQTAFMIHGSIEVITDTDWVPVFASTGKDKYKQDTVTLDILRNKIEAQDE